MPTDFTMPKLGLTMEEGTVVRWLVAEGDPVSLGQVVLEIQTDKVTVEVEAPAEGVLGPLIVREGQSAPVGAVLAQIVSPGEKPSKGTRVTPLARRIAAQAGIDIRDVKAAGERITAADVWGAAEVSGKRFSSPRARKRAREAGIDWQTLNGSGPRGRVIERDVLGVAHPSAASPQVEPGRSASTQASPHVRWENPTAIQRIAAERTTATFASIPHFYLTSEVSAEALVEVRERLLPAVERRAGVRLTVTDLLAKIAATALREHPRANAFWHDGRIGLYEQVNVGIATATDAGLLVPVLHGAEQLSLAEVARERSRLVEAARRMKLAPEDLAGGTFTLSNLGTHRVDQFQPVLNSLPNESANGAQSVILAVGRIAPRPFVVNSQLAVARTVALTIACDHRVLDGDMAAAFFDRLIQLVEEPYELLV